VGQSAASYEMVEIKIVNVYMRVHSLFTVTFEVNKGLPLLELEEFPETILSNRWPIIFLSFILYEACLSVT
jgi:hypothetical protein